jgi:MATE family multidrug resistance protein
MTAHTLMVFVDGLFLARYSAEAIAAVGPASMAGFCVGSLVTGAVSYTSVLASHYHGANRARRIGPAVWQGIWISLIAGCVVAAFALPAKALFAAIGHDALVQRYETEYFRIVSMGMAAAFVTAAVSGFYAGRGDTRTVMYVQLLGLATNVVLDYGLIFGRLGMPSWGVRGAAVATVIAHVVSATVAVVLFLGPANQERFGTREGWRWNGGMMMRLLRFGMPNGLRFFVELLAWTLFLFFVGRIGTVELATTTIAWRINGVAFFPVMGISQAVAILVGQAQGRRRSWRSVHVTWQGLALAAAFTLTVGATYALFPEAWYRLFQGRTGVGSPIVRHGIVLLRFVAAYCLFDAANMILCGALIAAGDTRWASAVSFGGHMSLVAALAVADRLRLGMYVEWTCATVFVIGIAGVWLARFVSGAWRHGTIIESAG